LSTERQLTGRLAPNRILTRDSGSSREIINIKTAEQLGNQLSSMKRNGEFPATITVFGSQMNLLEGRQYVCDDLMSIGGPHVLQVTDYDEVANKVYVDGSNGNARDYSGKAGELPPLSKEQLFDLMDNGADKTKHLRLRGKAFGEEMLKQGLFKLPSLETVDLANTSLSNRGLENLRGRVSIKSLTVSSTNIDDNCADTLSSLPNLSRLSLADTAIGDRTLQALSNTKSLSSIDLTVTKVTAEGVMDFAKRSGVKKIIIEDGVLSEEHIGSLKESGCDVEILNTHSPDISRFNRLKYPTKVFLNGLPIGLKDLARFEGVRSLKSLDLRDTKVDDSCRRVVSSLPNLENLGLGNTAVSDQILPDLTALSQLKLIDLSGTKITENGLTQFSHKNAPSVAVDAELVNPVSVRNVIAAGGKIYAAPSARSPHTSFVVEQKEDKTSLRWTFSSPDSIKDVERFADVSQMELSLDAKSTCPRLDKFKNLTSLSLVGLKIDKTNLDLIAELKDLKRLAIERTNPANAPVRLSDYLNQCKS
ncbi:MAG: hypothetical protein K2Z81_09960, partial [Cyanobacteria bacterium]|nr:hypothetical protein [Cyanobacteriota bacterium]